MKWRAFWKRFYRDDDFAQKYDAVVQEYSGLKHAIPLMSHERKAGGMRGNQQNVVFTLQQGRELV